VISRQRIPRNIEKSLDLSGMQIHQNIAIRAGHFDHIGHQFGCDRHARLIFLIGPGIAKIRDDRRNAGGGIQLERLNQNQQLHQIAMNRSGSGLNHIAILAPNAASQLNKKIFIGELDDLSLAQRDPDIIRDFLCERFTTGAAEQLDIPVHQVMSMI